MQIKSQRPRTQSIQNILIKVKQKENQNNIRWSLWEILAYICSENLENEFKQTNQINKKLIHG